MGRDSRRLIIGAELFKRVQAFLQVRRHRPGLQFTSRYGASRRAGLILIHRIPLSLIFHHHNSRPHSWLRSTNPPYFTLASLHFLSPPIFFSPSIFPLFPPQLSTLPTPPIYAYNMPRSCYATFILPVVQSHASGIRHLVTCLFRYR